MANATEVAAAAKAKTALVKVLRQRNNENTAKFFAAGMAGMMVLFMIFHWTRVVFKRYESRKSESISLSRIPVSLSRYGYSRPSWKHTHPWWRNVRSLVLRKIPGFTSGGHALIYIGYIATCVSIAFVNLDWSVLNNWAKRLGWWVHLLWTLFQSGQSTSLWTFLQIENFINLYTIDSGFQGSFSILKRSICLIPSTQIFSRDFNGSLYLLYNPANVQVQID